MKIRHLAAASVLSLVACCVALAQPLPKYRLTGQISLVNPDKWDYVYFNGNARHVFVAHGSNITVVSSENKRVIGHINGIAGAHGIATDDQLGLGFADNGKTGVVSVFQLSSLRVVDEIPADKDSDAVAYDPVEHTLIVANGEAHDASIIDAKARKLIVNVPLGGDPEGVVMDRAGYAYINIANKRDIVRINVKKRKIDGRWSVPQCMSPHGLAIDPERHRLFSSCENGKLVVVNSNDGHVISTLPIGMGSDTVVFDPVRKLIFSSNNDGTLSEIAEASADRFYFVGNIITAPGARTMAEDPVTGRIFVVTANVLASRLSGRSDKAPKFKFVPGTVKMLLFDPVH